MNLIIKPTGRCNARCLYCQADGGEAHAGVMSEATLDHAIGECTAFAAEHPGEGLTWTWHGGEPLLAGKEFFRRVLDLERAHERRLGVTSRNVIQSNLTLLDPEFADILRALVGPRGIGTSYDIFPELRPLAGDGSYEERWLAAIEILRRKQMPFGLSYVVHRETLGQERRLYGFFKSLDGELFVRCNPLLHLGRGGGEQAAPYRITAEEYGEFLVRMAELWEADHRRVHVQPLVEWVEHWEGRARARCCDSSGRCHETHLGVSPDGGIANCGRASDVGILAYGNLNEQPLAEILAARARSPLARRAAALRDGPCGSCLLFDGCHGGCPVDAHAHRGDVLERTGWCASRLMLAARYRKRSVAVATAAADDVASATDESSETSTRIDVHRCAAAAPGERTRIVSVPWARRRAVPPGLFGRFAVPVFRIATSAELDEARAEQADLLALRGRLFLESTALLLAATGLRLPLQVCWSGAPTPPDPGVLAAALKLLAGADRRQISFCVEAERRESYDDVLLLASLGYGVTLRLAGPDPPLFGELSRVLDYYLHTSSLTAPIQPHHGLMRALVDGDGGSLWRALGEEPGVHWYVTGDGRVTLSARLAVTGPFFGEVGDGLAAWAASPAFQRLARLEWALRAEHRACHTCELFGLCRGYFAPLEPTAAPWDCSAALAFLREIEEAHDVLRRQAVA